LNEVTNKEAANHLQYQIRDLIKSIGKYSLKICEGFGVPSHLIYAPIYTGYQEYYKVDKTDGEHYSLMNAKF
jgi:hypothetical protein